MVNSFQPARNVNKSTGHHYYAGTQRSKFFFHYSTLFTFGPNSLITAHYHYWWPNVQRRNRNQIISVALNVSFTTQ